MTILTAMLGACLVAPGGDTTFEGRYFAGRGDVEYLELLDISARMFAPDPEFQNLPMLYTPAWNGFVEGPTWGMWWIQNSYGPTYCSLPFWQEPYTTFIQNSQDLWFDQMGDGKRAGVHDWVAPDGALCDAASPGKIIYKQGDGKIDIHDWGMEFTAAGVVMQAELLLISRDPKAIEKYLPKLERSVNFIESRRDPSNNLFLAGPAGNLLAPSYAAWHKPDGSYGKAYLAGLSITYIAALDRLIELEKLAGRADMAGLYEHRRDLARHGLAALATDEGYFVKYIDPDGTRHGVYGAPKHGYFEAVCNHDAVCFRVVDDAQARRIFDKIASIPQLRPYDLIITNYPALDDMYHPQESIWKFGHWVNGGHWSTCEARAIMGYYRLGMHEDARRSMKKLLTYARAFRMDNPLKDFGNAVYQPHVPINCVYDNWGIPAAMIRGLFEYLYTARGVRIVPHVPASISQLEQKLPIRLGDKRLYLSTCGSGEITSVRVNGEPLAHDDGTSFFLPYEATPDVACIQIALGGADLPAEWKQPAALPPLDAAVVHDLGDRSHGNFLPVRIGADSEGGHRFVGDIRRLRIHAEAASAERIAEFARQANATVRPSRNLVGEWVVGRGNRGYVRNQVRDGAIARVVGDVDYAGSDRGRVGRFAGKGYLELGDDPRLDLDEAFTFDVWMCPAAFPDGGMRIIDKCTVGTNDGYTFDTHPGNGLRLITPCGTVSHDAKLEAGKWVHVAATFTAGGELRLYVDGKQVASAPAKHPTKAPLARIARLYRKLCDADLGECYEARHARLTLDCAAVVVERRRLLEAREMDPLETPARQAAADRSYATTVARLAEGLAKVIGGYANTEEAHSQRVWEAWKATE